MSGMCAACAQHVRGTLHTCLGVGLGPCAAVQANLGLAVSFAHVRCGTALPRHVRPPCLCYCGGQAPTRKHQKIAFGRHVRPGCLACADRFCWPTSPKTIKWALSEACVRLRRLVSAGHFRASHACCYQRETFGNAPSRDMSGMCRPVRAPTSAKTIKVRTCNRHVPAECLVCVGIFGRFV